MTYYRTSTQIVSDLLVATKESGYEGIKTTALLSRSNLNHGRMQAKLSRLISSGLVDVKFGKNYVITPKGQLFLEQYKKFVDVAEAMGLEI